MLECWNAGIKIMLGCWNAGINKRLCWNAGININAGIKELDDRL